MYIVYKILCKVKACGLWAVSHKSMGSLWWHKGGTTISVYVHGCITDLCYPWFSACGFPLCMGYYLLVPSSNDHQIFTTYLLRILVIQNSTDMAYLPTFKNSYLGDFNLIPENAPGIPLKWHGMPPKHTLLGGVSINPVIFCKETPRRIGRVGKYEIRVHSWVAKLDCNPVTCD